MAKVPPLERAGLVLVGFNGVVPKDENIRAGNSGGFQIVADDENWNFAISRNDNRPGNPTFEIGPVAAFLPHELKTNRDEDALQSFPVNWPELGLGRSSRDRRGMFLDGNPVGTLPARAVVFIAGVLQNFGQRAVFFRRLDEKFHGFVQRGARGLRRWAGTRHVQRHRVGNELTALAPDLDGVIDFHNATNLHACLN